MRAQVVVLRDNEILLARHVKNNRSFWVLPGGSIEAGESPEDAARREMCEETGFAIRIERLLFIDEPRDVGTVRIREPRYTFLSRIDGPCDADAGSGDVELAEVRWMPIDGVYDAATEDTLQRVNSALHRPMH